MLKIDKDVLKQAFGKVWRAGNRLCRMVMSWFSFGSLVAIGILILLQQHGVFEDYPYINDIITITAGLFNWVCAIVVKIVSWVLSFPLFQWLANLI